MRSLSLALLLVGLTAGTARAVTPVVVDRESLQLQLQTIAAQLANVQAQVAQTPDPRMAQIINQLQSAQGQLNGLARRLNRAPVAAAAGEVTQFPGGPGTVVPPPPAPPPGPQPIDEATLAGGVERIEHESFSQDKLRIVRELAGYYFLVAHVERILPLFSFETDKIKALELLAPRILDRQNGFRLYSLFTFSSNKQKAERMLQR